jgi:hypothetical protein
MACFDRETATGYLRGDLDTHESLEWTSHLSSCQRCQGVLGEVSELIDAVRADLMILSVQATSPNSRRPEHMYRALIPPTFDSTWLLRFLSAGGVALMVATIAWGVSRLGSSPVSAAELIQASTRAEAEALPPSGSIGQRTYTISESRGLLQPPTTQHVEVWIDSRIHRRVRRVFDQRRRVIAGEWTAADGSRVIYERGRAPRREAATDPKPLTAASAWRWEPSANTLLALSRDASAIDARATRNGFALALRQDAGAIAVAEVVLTTERLPIAQRIVLRADNGRLIELRFVRESSADVESDEVTLRTFEPDAELLPAKNPPASIAPGAPAVANPRAALDFDKAELEATFAVHKLGSCLARPGEWRKTSRQFRLSVVVGSDECRHEAVTHLTRLAALPGVSIDLSVVYAATKSPDARTTTTSKVGELRTFKDSVVYRQLYSWAATRLGLDPSRADDSVVQEQVAEAMNRIQAHSTNLRSFATDLHRLIERWPFEVLQKVGPETARAWVTLVYDEAAALSVTADAIIVEMRPVLGTLDVPPLSPNDPQYFSLTDVHAAVGELSTRATVTESAIATMLAGAADADRSPTDLQQLQDNLYRLSRLGKRLSNGLTGMRR